MYTMMDSYNVTIDDNHVTIDDIHLSNYEAMAMQRILCDIRQLRG